MAPGVSWVSVSKWMGRETSPQQRVLEDVIGCTVAPSAATRTWLCLVQVYVSVVDILFLYFSDLFGNKFSSVGNLYSV